MHKQKTNLTFKSVLADQMVKFICEKQSCGYSYESDCHALHRLDRFLCGHNLKSMELPKELVDEWTSKRENEKVSTQKLRIIRIRQFTLFLKKHEVKAWIPEGSLLCRNHQTFTPYIFRRSEIKNILQAADGLTLDGRTPLRHLIMPEVFRLLYCCGMRVGEVVNLTVADVDLDSGVLYVRGKSDKDRLVPLAPAMTRRLRIYASILNSNRSNASFFPAPSGGSYSIVTIYFIFRELLRKCGISHKGRGKGPRMHELRHAFAVHRLESWYRQGVDLNAKLPVLATYLGHRSLVGTQRYLQLTPEIYSDINDRMDRFVGNLIPGGPNNETH